MNAHQIDHIALHVESPRQAARFYARLFGLDLLTSPDSASASSPGGPAGEGNQRSDAQCDRYLLGRGGIRLLLTDDSAESTVEGRLAHIGLRIPAQEIASCGLRASGLGCRLLEEDAVSVVFEDVYGIRWHVSGEGKARNRVTS